MNALIDAFDALPDDTSLAVAYSGGPDSTALLHALANCRPGRIRAIHVRHNLGNDAAHWAAHCAAFCHARAIEYVEYEVDARADIGRLGVEAAARRVRYQALAAALDHDNVLAVAHHAGDQAETFLTQALRGAGVDGLAAMPEWRRLGHGWLWRPWLGQPRSRVRAYIDEHGLATVSDPSNHDDGLARGFLRNRVMPAIEAGWPGHETTLARSAAWAAEAADAMATLAAIDFDTVAEPDGTLDCVALGRLAGARRRAVLRHWLWNRSLDTPDHRHLAQIETLLTARSHNSPRVCFGACEIRLFAGRFFAMPRLASPPGDETLAWDGMQSLELPDDAGRLSALSRAPAALTVAFRRGGERMARPNGPDKKLADWLHEQRIAPWLRERLPLVKVDGRLIAVADRWLAPDIDIHLPDRRTDFVWRHALVGDAGAHC